MPISTAISNRVQNFKWTAQARPVSARLLSDPVRICAPGLRKSSPWIAATRGFLATGLLVDYRISDLLPGRGRCTARVCTTHPRGRPQGAQCPPRWEPRSCNFNFHPPRRFYFRRPPAPPARRGERKHYFVVGQEETPRREANAGSVPRA